mgnify:CR=1 FL=1
MNKKGSYFFPVLFILVGILGITYDFGYFPNSVKTIVGLPAGWGFGIGIIALLIGFFWTLSEHSRRKVNPMCLRR